MPILSLPTDLALLISESKLSIGPRVFLLCVAPKERVKCTELVVIVLSEIGVHVLALQIYEERVSRADATKFWHVNLESSEQ